MRSLGTPIWADVWGRGALEAVLCTGQAAMRSQQQKVVLRYSISPHGLLCFRVLFNDFMTLDGRVADELK